LKRREFTGLAIISAASATSTPRGECRGVLEGLRSTHHPKDSKCNESISLEYSSESGVPGVLHYSTPLGGEGLPGGLVKAGRTAPLRVPESK
jgi:hypothetical protein